MEAEDELELEVELDVELGVADEEDVELTVLEVAQDGAALWPGRCWEPPAGSNAPGSTRCGALLVPTGTAVVESTGSVLLVV